MDKLELKAKELIKQSIQTNSIVYANSEDVCSDTLLVMSEGYAEFTNNKYIVNEFWGNNWRVHVIVTS